MIKETYLSKIAELLGPKSFRKISSLDGEESYIYKIKFKDVYYIVKFPKKPKVNYKFEAFCYQSLKKIDANIPYVYHVSNDMLMISCIKGRGLDDRPYLFKRSIFKEAAKDLYKCRNITIETALQVMAHNNTYDMPHIFDLSGEFDGAISSIKGINLSAPEKKIITGFINRNLYLLKNKKYSLLHGDYCLDHIFVCNSKYSGTIDFGDAFFGDPLMDLAYFKLKDANKFYGINNFNKLSSAYFEFVANEDKSFSKKEAEIKINLYAIWWAIRRISLLKDAVHRRKFIEKLKVLIPEMV